ncbi:MAG: hypothetical protein ACJA01_002785, partial [Saprospiraceae bacterium]
MDIFHKAKASKNKQVISYYGNELSIGINKILI